MSTPDARGDVRRMVSDVDWSAYVRTATVIPQSETYEPESVPRAFERLLAVGSETDGTTAYHAMLYAVGNNHAGVLYPAAIAAAPILVQVVRALDGWPKRTAIEVLIEFLCFSVDIDQFVAPDGRYIDVKDTIRAAIVLLRKDLEDIVAQSSAPSSYASVTQRSAQDLLERLDDPA